MLAKSAGLRSCKISGEVRYRSSSITNPYNLAFIMVLFKSCMPQRVATTYVLISVAISFGSAGVTNGETKCLCICQKSKVVQLEKCNKPLPSACVNVPCTYRTSQNFPVNLVPGFVCCITSPIFQAYSVQSLKSIGSRRSGTKQTAVTTPGWGHLRRTSNKSHRSSWKVVPVPPSPLISVCHCNGERKLLSLRLSNVLSYTFGAASNRDAFRLAACLRGMLRIGDKNILSAIDELHSRAATNSALCKPASACGAHMSPPYCTCCDSTPSCWIPTLMRLSHECD